VTWTRITEADEAIEMLPAWFGSRMVGLRGRFGLLLTTGDIMKITSIAAISQSSLGVVLLDVMLDHAGVPDGVDLAWEPKHYLGAPVPGATVATVNLAHVVAVIEFVAEEMVDSPQEAAIPGGDEIEEDRPRIGSLSDTIERANEVGAA
jgi:hypothetical protein